MSPFCRRTFITFLLALTMASAALAGDTPTPRRQAEVAQSKSAQTATIDVWVVEARKTPGPVDKSLEPFARELRSKGLQSFVLRAKVQSKVSPGEVARIPVDNRRVEVKLLEIMGNEARVRVRLAQAGERTLEFTMTLPRNRTFLWGGPKTRTGVMVLPITVKW